MIRRGVSLVPALRTLAFSLMAFLFAFWVPACMQPDVRPAISGKRRAERRQTAHRLCWRSSLGSLAAARRRRKKHTGRIRPLANSLCANIRIGKRPGGTCPPSGKAGTAASVRSAASGTAGISGCGRIFGNWPAGQGTCAVCTRRVRARLTPRSFFRNGGLPFASVHEIMPRIMTKLS